MPTVTCFGEVLWDVFPTHKKIGGAPLNVALRLNSFKNNTYIISSVGDDDDGKEVLQYIHDHGMITTSIQIDKMHKTGCVLVTLNNKGSATYEIEYPVAWDNIKATEEAIDMVRSSDALIYGSLACRDEVSKSSLLTLLPYAKMKVFDVNLRPPFYSMELLLDLMSKASFIKLNDEELIEICNALKFDESAMEEQIKFLSNYTKTDQICVTIGKHGALLLYDGRLYRNKGYKVNVADTVGAGDSFLATLINNLLNKKKPAQALDMAAAVGAMVAGKEGANPVITNSEIDAFMSNPSNKNG
jgi:fructokinase